ncbi:hypothetical protein ABW20_dc0107275 [Dactylellina cionopaga]|nr:hypothetical protein ABW20_dc0107275 [Dactylellina cionopaga]
MPDEIVVPLPENRAWIGFMVGVTESGIVRLKPLTHPPWKEARWIGSSTSMTESKLGWNTWHEHEPAEQTALAKRRAEGFKVIGPVHDYYCDFSFPAAEGRLTVPPEKWSVGGIMVGLGTLRLTSIALIEYRNEETTSKRDKGKGKAMHIEPEPAPNAEKIMVDGEEVACEPLPLGDVDNILSRDEHFDGVPDLIDRYCWRPYFPVPYYNEDNVTDVTISPRNFSFAFPKTYVQDALLSAGLPVPPESHIYWNGPNFGQPPSTPPLRVPRNRDELNIMEYFDFGGPGGKYLRRLLSVKAFYASHTNGAARGVSGFEFTYEMDEADVNDCKLRDGNSRPQERFVEVRRGGVDLHYLSCAATIDGKGGERIVRVGTKHLCLSERSYLGVMLITNFGRKLEFPACLPPATRRRSRRRLRRVPRIYPSGGGGGNPPPPGDDGAGPAPTPYWLPSPGGPPVPIPLPPLPHQVLQSSKHASSSNKLPMVIPPPPVQFGSSPFGLTRPSRIKKVKLGDLRPSMGLIPTPPKYVPFKAEGSTTKTEAAEGSKGGNITKEDKPTSSSEKSNTEGSASKKDESSKENVAFEAFLNDPASAPMASPDIWDDTLDLGLLSATPTWRSENTKPETEDISESSTTYDFFKTDSNTLITGFFGCTDGKPYLGEGLKAFGVVTQTPSEAEKLVLEARDVSLLDPPEQLEPGAPTACFSQLERAKYWKRHADDDVIKDFVNKVNFDEPIARVRVFCRPSYHLFSGYSKHAANGVGLIFEYHPEDLVEDGCGGWRPRAARVLGELREENATGSFELERDERIDGFWVWCADRTRVSKSHVNELGYRGADVIAALRFRTNKGKCSKIFGGDRGGTCHFFESSGKKRLAGLRMTYDYMSDWISPIWQEEEEDVVTEKADPKLRYIPFGWSVLNRPLSVIQVFADLADAKDFGPDQIMTIRGYFDHQFRGLAFIYKSGESRSFGKCIGASIDYNLEDGERIFAVRYRPGSNFSLHFSLVKIDPETGDISTRSTPLFGVDIAGFGLPPLDGYVRDTKTWRHIFEDEVKPSERDYNYSTDESSDYNRMLVSATPDPNAPLASIDYSELSVPPPPTSLMPILDPHVDSDDPSAEVKTFNGRPFVPPLPWLGTYPTERLPGDAVISRKIGAQIGAVRLWVTLDKSQMMDISVYYSFPNRLVHIHGIEFSQFLKQNKRTGTFGRQSEITRLGTTGFMTTLCKTTRITNKLRERKMVGLKVGMVTDVHQRIPPPTPGTLARDVILADWPIKARRTKGGEPQIVTLEILLDNGESVLLTPPARESTHRNKCPPRLVIDTIMCPEGHEIIGLHGNFGLYCHAIGIISAPFRELERKSPQQQQQVSSLSALTADDILMSID